jgi:hypothetical protein
MKFWIPWGIDVVIALVFVGFFFVGLADGSVSSFNMGLWLLTLAALAGVVGGSLALRAAARLQAATALVMILAIPGVLVGLLFLAMIVVPVRWN